MTGDEEAQNLFFSGETLVLVPLREIRQSVVAVIPGSRRFIENTEEAVLPAFDVALCFLSSFDGLVHDGHELRAMAERVHRARFDQRLEYSLVEQAQVDVLAEFVKRLEVAEFLPCLDDRLDSV